MCSTQLDLVMALMEQRVEEARRAAEIRRMVVPPDGRLQRQAGLLLARVGTWLASTGEHLANTSRGQPTI